MVSLKLAAEDGNFVTISPNPMSSEDVSVSNTHLHCTDSSQNNVHGQLLSLGNKIYSPTLTINASSSLTNNTGTQHSGFCDTRASGDFNSKNQCVKKKIEVGDSSSSHKIMTCNLVEERPKLSAQSFKVMQLVKEAMFTTQDKQIVDNIFSFDEILTYINKQYNN